MNHKLVLKYLGFICTAVGMLMLVPAGWAVHFEERGPLGAFAASLVICVVAGLALLRLGRGAPSFMYEREAVALVSVTWMLACAFGAVPYMLSGTLGPIDSFFESVSGFTTTGSTVIADIEAVPKSILFWRSFTHWLGGIGIVIMFIAVLPYFTAGGKLLVKSETTGPAASSLRPRFRDNALLLFKVYMFLTVINVSCYLIAQMDLYDSLCHAFGALATGGFSTKQDSIAAFDSLSVEVITIAFMIIGGTNFGLFAQMYLGDWKAIFRDSEWRLYLTILVIATFLVTLNLTGVSGTYPQGGAAFEPVDAPRTYSDVGEAFRVAVFQVTSCVTDTGYVTEDFDRWPFFSKMVLVVLMCLGGSAGSTSSGIKIVRVLMFLKLVYYRLESTFRPKTVRPLRINGEVVSDDIQRKALIFFCLYMMWFALGCLVMSYYGLPFESAVSAVAACFNNCGPGLEHVGAVRDFHLIGPGGTMFLSLTMLLGRLELIPILVLFVPAFWRR